VCSSDLLRALVEELGLGEAVLFEENADMPDLYAAADIVVNSARFDEPMGRVVPEALVAGRPVVATEVGAVHEVIRDGADGLIVPRDEPQAMADAVLELWRDPERAARLVASGRERVPVLFGPEQDLAAWQDVIAAAEASTRRGR
jgi:glycosyltransferase involved in cell wall biosynthesis